MSGNGQTTRGLHDDFNEFWDLHDLESPDVTEREIHQRTLQFITDTRRRINDVLLFTTFLEELATDPDEQLAVSSAAGIELARIKAEETAAAGIRALATENARIQTEADERVRRAEAVANVNAQAAIDTERTRADGEERKRKEKEDELARIQAEAAARAALRDNQLISASVYAGLDIPQGSNDHDAEHDWEHHKSYNLAHNPKQKVTYKFNQYLRDLAKPENIGFDISKSNNDFENIDPLDFSDLVNAYFRVKCLTELPADNEARLPKSAKVQNFLRSIYEVILERIQNHLLGNVELEVNEVRYLKEIGIDIDEPIAADESVASRMTDVREKLTNTATYLSNPNNQTNLDRIIERTYGRVEKDIKSNQKKIQEKQDARDKNFQMAYYWLSPLEEPGITRPMTYPRGMLWDWTTKPILGLVSKGWQKTKALVKANPHESIGAGVGLVAAGGIPAGAVLGAAVVRFFKKIAGGGGDKHGDDHGGGHH